MTPHEILVDARALLTDPEHWTQGTFARDRRGYPVSAASENAVCWCTYGALTKATPGGELRSTEVFRAAHAVIDLTVREMGFGSVVQLNDSYGHCGPGAKAQVHGTVLLAFDLAIARSKR